VLGDLNWKLILDVFPIYDFSFDVNSIQLGDCTVIVSVLDFNGGVVKDNFIGRVILGKEASGKRILYTTFGLFLYGGSWHKSFKLQISQYTRL